MEAVTNGVRPAVPVTILVLGTAAAIVCALLTYVVAGAAVHVAFYIFHRIFTVLRPTVMHLAAALPSAFLGVWASRWLCDRLLGFYYWPKAVACTLVFVLAGLCVWEFFVIPFRWIQAVSYLQSLAGCVVAFSLFWSGERLN